MMAYKMLTFAWFLGVAALLGDDLTLTAAVFIVFPTLNLFSCISTLGPFRGKGDYNLTARIAWVAVAVPVGLIFIKWWV